MSSSNASDCMCGESGMAPPETRPSPPDMAVPVIVSCSSAGVLDVRRAVCVVDAVVTSSWVGISGKWFLIAPVTRVNGLLTPHGRLM